ncbi:hypothetical protein Tco_0112206 [Tanacetum coccineum]
MYSLPRLEELSSRIKLLALRKYGVSEEKIQIFLPELVFTFPSILSSLPRIGVLALLVSFQIVPLPSMEIPDSNKSVSNLEFKMTGDAAYQP